MEILEINNKKCIYLNHQDLITNLYKMFSPKDFKSYKLKPELFDFKCNKEESAKDSAKNHDETPTQPIGRKRKRKLKAELETAEVLKIKMSIEPFLQLLQSRLAQKPEESYGHFERIWENANEFPKFHGENNTNEFQTTNFESESFLIPPQVKFFNCNVTEDFPKLPNKYDLIIMDMPWHNKYIKRLKKVKQDGKALAYKMLDNEELKNLPIANKTHMNSLVVLWCTNSQQHKTAIVEEFLPLWNLQLVHQIKWFKINTKGDLITQLKSEGHKQPFEHLYIACRRDRSGGVDQLADVKSVEFLISIPSIIHSHKPPLVAWLKQYCLSNNDEVFQGLEIFARYLQPNFTSIGLEVLKLMNRRLYDE